MIRVRDLARELAVGSDQLVEDLASRGVPAMTPDSVIDGEVAQSVRRRAHRGEFGNGHGDRSRDVAVPEVDAPGIAHFASTAPVPPTEPSGEPPPAAPGGQRRRAPVYSRPEDEDALWNRPHAQLLEVLRRYWVSVSTAVVLSVLLASVFGAGVAPSFLAETSVLLEPLPSTDGVPQRGVEVPTQVTLIESGVLAPLVVEELGEPDLGPDDLQDGLEVSGDDEAEVVEFAYTGAGREEAVRRASTYVDVYLAFREGRATQIIEERRRSAQQELEVLQAEESDLQQRLAAAGDAEAGALRSRLGTVLNEIGDRRATLALLDGASPSVGSVLSPAAVEGGPLGISRSMFLLIGLLAGLVLGVSQAAVRANLDDRVREADELERLLGAPELSKVPRHNVGGRVRLDLLGVPDLVTKASPDNLVAKASPDSPAAAAYRVLAVSLLARTGESGRRSVVVVGRRPGDGATTTVANVAHALATMGRRVVVVSADMRHPQVHEHLGTVEGPGLCDVLTGSTTLGDVDLSTPHSGVRLLRAGTAERRQMGMLGSDEFARVLERLEDDGDIVLVDAPPLETASDAVEAASESGEVVLVVRMGGLNRQQARSMVRPFDNVGATIAGFVRTRTRFDWLR